MIIGAMKMSRQDQLHGVAGRRSGEVTQALKRKERALLE